MTEDSEWTDFTNRVQKLIADESVPRVEKIRALEDVRLDLLERQRATEENMETKSTEYSGKIAEQLKLITNALSRIREGASDSDGE